ncbi:hypothetical protein JH06_1587 [Blastocystis sp. subtype 4]|uniref:hypothetical protein n=1 Tax=Blastocystis sp. subtype 4 TaxID=944170 RepID=UPI000711F2AF|nr:hypothetical protein JH06_1587 [Blastocystis sp. subtype 4]KNB44865.1 hypothetical protein JH06_1587 [Blastocystis sp. subtype 4]|eukprot:XP_014528308.1 hypothetical protein JH06_1587 [Blastocystis sp. subtype 4]
MRMKWIDDSELIVTSCIESLIIADHFNRPDISSLILNNSLISLKRIEIGDDCFEKVTRFEIDGLNELETIIIGSDSFYLDEITKEVGQFVIMNCDQLRLIQIGEDSFYWYESFELKNLPSLISIQLDDESFYSQTIVFENLIRLQSITLGSSTLTGDEDVTETNVLIMKNLPSLSLIKGDGDNFGDIFTVILENIPSLTSEGIQLTYNAFGEVKELLCSNADSLEYYITVNSNMTPSEHLLSLYPSSLWISETSQMNQISTSVESIVIQEGVGEEDEIFFTLSNLPSLKTLEMGCLSFYECHSIVFENLIQLQSIKLGSYAFEGDEDTVESNVLIMRNLPSLTTFKGYENNFCYIGKVILEDIPSLTQDGIQINGDDTFCEVKELLCSNADALEYYITFNNRNITPSEHLLSLDPSSLWISETSQMNQISTSVESIVIQGNVKGDKELFTLSNLPSLKTLEMGPYAFHNCHSIVFENLDQLQSITLQVAALQGSTDTTDSNVLIMRNLPSLSLIKGAGNNFCYIGKVILENMQALKEHGIKMDYYAFKDVKELVCSNADSLDQYIQQKNTSFQNSD